MPDRSLRVRLEAITTGFRGQMAAAQAQTRTFTQNLEKNAMRNQRAFRTMGVAGMALGGAIGFGLLKASTPCRDRSRARPSGSRA